LGVIHPGVLGFFSWGVCGFDKLFNRWSYYENEVIFPGTTCVVKTLTILSRS
jgi:hypothetical protein